MVDLVRARGIEVPERVVRDRREVDDGVEAPQVIDLDVPDVQAKRRHRVGLRPERAALEPERVEPRHVVTRVTHHRREDTLPM